MTLHGAGNLINSILNLLAYNLKWPILKGLHYKCVSGVGICGFIGFAEIFFTFFPFLKNEYCNKQT